MPRHRRQGVSRIYSRRSTAPLNRTVPIQARAAPQGAETTRASATVSALACPVCGRGVGSVSIGFGPVYVKVCNSCAATGYGIARLLMKLFPSRT